MGRRAPRPQTQPPASLCRAAAAAAAERQQRCGRGPAWCGALRGGEQAARPGPRCQGAGRGAGLLEPRRPCSSSATAAPAASPAATPAIVPQWSDDAIRPAGYYRVWPSGRSSLKIRPPPPRRPPARSGFGPARLCGAESALQLSSPVEVTLLAQIGVRPSGGWQWKGGCTVRRGRQFGGEAGSRSPRVLAVRFHPSSQDDHLPFPVPERPSREDLRRSRPLVAAVCLISPHPRSGVRTQYRGDSNHQDASYRPDKAGMGRSSGDPES